MTLVLVGAGRLGRKLLPALRAKLMDVVAFSDRDSAKWGERIDGVTVYSLNDAVKRFPDATFCVTIWGANSSHRIKDTEAELREGGISDIVSFATLLRSCGMSHYFIGPEVALKYANAKHPMNTAAELFTDPLSESTYFENCYARVSGNLHSLPEPVAGPQYFPDDLFRYRADEVILDGGAYDGDTLRSFDRDFAKWIAFEPHPGNAEKFRSYMIERADPRVVFSESALGRKAGMVRMTIDGGLSAQEDTYGTVVPVLALDAFSPIPTFIKLDIEGAELDAIEGARALIHETRPVLAVCVYHTPDHLWRIPLRLKELMPDAKFYLRPYGGEGWDLTCIVVPPERAL